MITYFDTPIKVKGRRKTWPYRIYIGDYCSPLWHDPLGFQMSWLEYYRGAHIREDVHENLIRLFDIANNHDLSFRDLCKYALVPTKENKKKLKTNKKNSNLEAEDGDLKAVRNETWKKVVERVDEFIEGKRNYKRPNLNRKKVLIAGDHTIAFSELEEINIKFANAVIKGDSYFDQLIKNLIAHGNLGIFLPSLIGKKKVSLTQKIWQNFCQDRPIEHEGESEFHSFVYNIAIFLDCHGGLLPPKTEAMLHYYFRLYDAAEPLYHQARSAIFSWAGKPYRGKDKQLKAIHAELKERIKEGDPGMRQG